MRSTTTPFSQTDFITPERLKAESLENVFAVRPRWADRFGVLGYDDPDEHIPANAIYWAVVGKMHEKVITLRPDEFALLFELSRFGGGVVTNSNHNKPVAQIYAKFAFAGAPEDLMSIRRILFGAAAGEITKALGTPTDYRAESTGAEDDHHPQKDARAKSLEHAKRLAHEAATKGTIPTGFYIAAYLDNIKRLFAEIDRRLGEEAKPMD